MIIDVRKKLAFLAITKCASSTVEELLSKNASHHIHLRGTAGLKHTNYRDAEKFIIPFLDSKRIERPHFFAVIREPADRLFSWYSYRTRDELAKASKGSNRSKRYTGNMQFSEFVRLNIEANDEELITQKTFITTTQFSYLQDSQGKIGVDTIIPIQHLDDFLPKFLNEFGYNLPIRKLSLKKNQSPKTKQIALNDDLRKAINTCDRFRRDYEIFIEATKNFEKRKF